jgi:hypothetical protein
LAAGKCLDSSNGRNRHHVAAPIASWSPRTSGTAFTSNPGRAGVSACSRRVGGSSRTAARIASTIAGRLPDKPWAHGLWHQPLHVTSLDQPSLPGVSNPYWEIVKRIPTQPRYDLRDTPCPNGRWISDLEGEAAYLGRRFGLAREDLCVRYAWSIPSPGDIAWIKNVVGDCGVLEIGAGAGYWAWQMAQAGIDVLAYDPEPPSVSNRFVKHRLYYNVQRGDQEAAAEHADRVLFMCWPPPWGDFAKRALHLYRGDTVLYAADDECCADPRFPRILRRDFEQIGQSDSHVTYWGIRDRLTAWRRKNSAPWKSQ